MLSVRDMEFLLCLYLDIAFYSAFNNRACVIFLHHIQYQFKQQTDRYLSLDRCDNFAQPENNYSDITSCSVAYLPSY